MQWNIIIILLILAVVVLRIRYENRTFTTTKYTIKEKNVSKDLDGFRIALLSDLHNQSYGIDNEKLLMAIQEANPDIILIAGDMIVGKSGLETETATKLLLKLSDQYPVFYGNGNHESRMKFNQEIYGGVYGEFKEALGKMNVHHLCNQSYSMKKWPVTITGLEIDEAYYRKFHKVSMEASYLNEVMGDADRTRYQILIAHNPVFFEQYADWGADLVVSGHVHGGMVRLPFIGGVISPQVCLFPKYDGGSYVHRGCHMILSRGLGTHTIKIRLFNKPELCIITLKEKE